MLAVPSLGMTPSQVCLHCCLSPATFHASSCPLQHQRLSTWCLNKLRTLKSVLLWMSMRFVVHVQKLKTTWEVDNTATTMSGGGKTKVSQQSQQSRKSFPVCYGCILVAGMSVTKKSAVSLCYFSEIPKYSINSLWIATFFTFREGSKHRELKERITRGGWACICLLGYWNSSLNSSSSPFRSHLNPETAMSL